MRPTTLGMYLPGDTLVHRLDPRVKLAVAIVFAIALFSVRSWWALMAIAICVALAVAAARIPARAALKGVGAVAVILAFTVAAQAIRWRPAVALIRLGPLGLSQAGLASGLFFAARIVLLVVGTSVVTLTSTPVELTDALEWSMRPLTYIGFPAHDVAMMLSVALRFVPVTADVADQVLTAQRARGARLDRGGPIVRARAWIPVLIPLFVDLFRRADRLAHAMEARCYRGGEGRTRLNELRMRRSDWTVLVTSTLVLVLVAVLAWGAPWMA